MAQRQFRSDDTSTWAEKYGNGSDSDYTPPTGTNAPTDSACTGTINTTSLTATNTSFASGQLILIHQTQGTGAGQWELNKISSYTAGTITTSYPLIYGYVTGAQVTVLHQYNSMNIAAGVTVTSKSWNGTVGGIFAKLINGPITIAGSLVCTGAGYRGGNNWNGVREGQQGEGTLGTGTNAFPNQGTNGNGGGGGTSNAGTASTAGGGAGGGNANAGTNGSNGTAGSNAGTGGLSAGSTNLTTIVFGGGGGQGGGQNSTPGAGGNGGGIIILIGKSITITGSITSSGANGVTPGATDGGGGGGAGGDILLKGQTIILGTSLATASSGNGGSGVGGAGNGGGGSVGRIHADYSSSFSGTTTPTIDTTQDSTLLDVATSNLFFAQL